MLTKNTADNKRNYLHVHPRVNGMNLESILIIYP